MASSCVAASEDASGRRPELVGSRPMWDGDDSMPDLRRKFRIDECDHRLYVFHGHVNECRYLRGVDVLPRSCRRP